MLLGKWARDLQPGDVRDCGPYMGRRSVALLEVLHEDLAVVTYTDEWSHYIHPDLRVRVVV